ncbi:maturase K [Trifolium medium]|uniref:Maturase K n=1 Tax=Trifolium medium TaxID=97028 RepID=A0A392N1W0_9FABA|nr:maturase K [Trifolium medium]
MWTEECEQALQHLKKALSEPPVLSRPEVEEVLYVYLAVSSEAVSAALIRETTEGQKPVYFTSKALQGPELRYQQIEKVALALITAARRLRQYFLAHTIVVRTDQPIKALLGRPDMAGRMLKWSLELSEFDIRYESRKALKAQALAEFVAEMTLPALPNNDAEKWTIFVDGASSSTGAGAGIILENGAGTIIEVSLALSFPTSNNQAEYEAFLAGLRLAKDVDAKEIKIFTDSQLVVSQVLGEYQAKNDNLHPGNTPSTKHRKTSFNNFLGYGRRHQFHQRWNVVDDELLAIPRARAPPRRRKRGKDTPTKGLLILPHVRQTIQKRNFHSTPQMCRRR